MSTGFLQALETGALRPEHFAPFPTRTTADRDAGHAATATLDALLDDFGGPAGAPPSGPLLDALRANGFGRLGNDPAIGGLALSPYAIFRLVEDTARRSLPIAQLVAAQAGIGAAALEPALPPGALREFLRDRIAAGSLSCFGFTEAGGRNNLWPDTTAVPAPDGGHYLLHGEKLHILGAPVADLLPITATAGSAGRRRLGVCFVDADSPGVVVRPQEFSGSRGLPIGAIRLDGVRVPAHRVLLGDEDSPGFPASAPLINPLVKLGELYVNAAPALAIAKNCLTWTREFLADRRIDGRPLAEREQIRRFAELSLAEVYALEGIVHWALLAGGPSGRWLERHLLKNITVRIASRVVDRTMGVLGGTGVETAESQHARAAVPAPVERAFRDVRLLRVMGNIDFRADFLVLRQLIGVLGDSHATGPEPHGDGHFAAASENVSRLAAACRELGKRYPTPEAIEERHQAVALLGRLAGEVFATCAVLGRTRHLAATGGAAAATARALSAVYCTEAEHRIAGLWRRFAAEDQTVAGPLAGRWLAGQVPASLLSSLLGDEEGEPHRTYARLDTAWPPTPPRSTST